MPPPSRQNTYGAVNMHQPTFGGGTAAMHGARLLEQDRCVCYPRALGVADMFCL